MSSSQNIVEKTYTSKDFIKDAISFQGAAIEDVTKYLLKKDFFKEVDIPKVTKYLSTVKGMALSGVLAWDTSKSTDDNIANVMGALTQDTVTAGIATGTVFAFTSATAALPVFLVGFALSYAARGAGIDLGQEFEDIYHYAESFQATNAIELQRFEEYKTSDIDTYNNMVKDGIFPQNTVRWNEHINELTEDLQSRKAQNLENTINYEKSDVIDENNSLSDIAKANNLTEEQLLEYNNLDIKPSDYSNIKEGTKIAIPNPPEVNDDISIYTDSEGNQKIIDHDTGKVFYYDVENYSLLEIDGNVQTYNRVNVDGTVSVQELGIGGISVSSDISSIGGITTKHISDSNYPLIYDDKSNISSHTQLDVLIRKYTNNNISAQELANANGYESEGAMREAFAKGETITTPTDKITSADKKTSEYIIGENKVTKVSPNENGELEINITGQKEIEVPVAEHTTPVLDNNYETYGSTVVLTKGQTISHIASKIDGVNSIDLLEYNGLTLEQAKNLPIGFQVKIPENIITTTGENGAIKIYEGYDDTGVVSFPDENGIKQTLNYDENSDLVMYGSQLDPSKITFTDSATGLYQEWQKDSNGNMYQSKIATDDFTIDYSQPDENNNKTVTNIDITNDTTFEEISSYTNFSKDDLQAFNLFDGENISAGNSISVPTSKNTIEGGYGEITQYGTSDGNSVFIVPNEDGTNTTYGTFEDGFSNQAAYEKSSNGSFNVTLSNADGSTRTIIANSDGYAFDSYGLENKVDFTYAQNSNGDTIVTGMTIKGNTSFQELVDSGAIPDDAGAFATLNGFDNVFQLENIPANKTYKIPDPANSFDIDETGTTVIATMDEQYTVLVNDENGNTQRYDTLDGGVTVHTDITKGIKTFYKANDEGEDKAFAHVDTKTNIKYTHEQWITKYEATGSQYGSTIGGQIGSIIISNNEYSNLEKIAISTASTVVVKNLGEYIALENNGIDGSESVDDIGSDTSSALQSAAVSFAISQYFAHNDNVSDILGIGGTIVGDIADLIVTTTGSLAIGTYLSTGSNIFTIAAPVTNSVTVAGNTIKTTTSSTFSTTTTTTTTTSADGTIVSSTTTTTPTVLASALVGAVGGYLGNAFGNEIMGWDTQEEMMGASVGSAVGTVTIMSIQAELIGTLLAMGPVGWVAAVFVAFFGSAIGNMIGGLLGGLFGGSEPPPPEAQAYFEFDEESGTYKLISSDSDNGGNEEGLINIGNSFAKQLMNMINVPGGQLVDADGMPEIYVSQLDELVKLNEQNGSFDNVSEMMANALSLQIPFINVEGGDPYILRAIHRTNESFFDDNPDVNEDADLELLYDNIELAQDYSKYMNESMVIIDEDGKIITDSETLQEINEEYQAIIALEDGDEKTALLDEFSSKYNFSTYKEYVDGLLEEISDEDIETYYTQRQELIDSYDEKIQSKNTKISNINSEIESINDQIAKLHNSIDNSEGTQKAAINIQITALNQSLSLLNEEKATLNNEINTLKQEKTTSLENFDSEHFKELEAIHWNEVFQTAEELQLDEHHYSEDFNKLNSEISKYNYDIHEENGELLDIDYDEYLEKVAQKALEAYIIRYDEEKQLEEQNKLLEENPDLELEEIEINDEVLSKEEALDILDELGYDLELGYENTLSALPIPTEENPVEIPTFEEFLKGEDTLGTSYDTVTEITPERFEELLEIAGIESPYENFELAEDAFSFKNKDITDLQFELLDGSLIITTNEKDVEDEEPKTFVIENWEKWDKENTHIDLPNGTKINLEAFLDLIGVEEGAGAIDVQEAFNELALNDEDLSTYMDQFESDNILIGTSLDDKINAFFEDNLIKAGSGDDEINTGAGDDIIIGGAGSDSISTSLGNDTVTYENSESAVYTSLKDGGTSGDAKGDTYDGVENLSGTAYNDVLSGDEANNILVGNAGNDILSGEEGADSLIGGEGIDLANYSDSDSYVQVNLSDNVAFNADAQGDTFDSIEGVQGSSYSDGIIGNSEENLVYAEGGDDRVSSQSGDDIVYAGDGNDYVKGDAGNDELHGNDGDDILIGGAGDDILYGDSGKNILLGDEGTDLVVYKGDSDEYQVLFLNENTVLVQSLDGTIKDTLRDIEEIAFDDAIFSIDYDNQVLVKKAQIETVEDTENEEDNPVNENSSSNNQAAAIATAAMIGTVASAETVETSEEETQTSNTTVIDDEESENDVNHTSTATILDENNPLFDQIQKIIEYENTKQDIISTSNTEEVNTEVISSLDDTTSTNVTTESKDSKVKENSSDIQLTNQDNDTNVDASLVEDESNNEVVEEELPDLLTPTINFDTTDVLEDNILLGLKITNPNANSSLQVVISGIPDDASLSAGNRHADGDWYLQQADLIDLGIIPGTNNADDFDIRIVATVVDIHGRVIQNVLNDTIHIEAVADVANFDVENETSNLEDNYIDLTISTSLVDDLGGPDGEESILLSIENIPEDASLTAGTKDEKSGIWYLLPEELEGLQIIRGEHISDDFTVKVTSYTTESENNSIASISEDIFVEVVAVADTPNLDVDDAYGDEDTQIPIDIVSTLVDVDESEILSVKIEGIPDSVILNKGLKDSDGNWNLTPAQLGNLYLTPELHNAEDFTIQVTARATENENGDIAEITKSIDVSVNAIADNVTFDLTQELTQTTEIVTEEDASITYLDIKTDFIDQDGSESVHYVVEGLPQGASLSNGEEVSSGKWKLEVADLDNLGIFLKANSDKDFQLKISAITTESENGNQETTVEYIDCKVESDADFANLDITNTQGYQNSFIDLDIKSSLTDTDGSETLEIIIEQVPDNALLSNGVKDSDGNWHLTVDDLEGLNIRPEFDSIEDIELKVRAITTETKNGDTQENVAYLNIEVDELPSNASIKVNATQISEDETCYLDIQIDESEMNSTDSIFLEVTIPDGFSLNNGIKQNDGTWKLYKENLDNLILNTPEDYAGSFFIDVVPSIVSASGEVNKSVIATKLPVDIIAVADDAILEANDLVANEDSLIYLNISSSLKDIDGSESLSLEIRGVPDDAILNVGKKENGVWNIDEKDIDLVAILPSENSSENMNLEIKAISTDSNGDTSEVIKNIEITINEDVDTPKLNVVNTFINNNEAILTINSQLLDQDNSETLEINISGIPEGANLNKGILNDDASYTLNSSELSDLKIENLDNNGFDLIVNASSNGEKTIQKTISVDALDQEYSISTFEFRTKPYMSLENLQIGSSTQDSSIKNYSDAQDTIYSGGGNDQIYSNGGADQIYSDESNGLVTVSFDLNSNSSDIKSDEKIIYTIEGLPDNASSSVGNIVDNKLIIEKEDLTGHLTLSYPYQNEQLNLNINTNVVNENDLNNYIVSSTLLLNIDPIDVAGNDYINSGEMADTVNAGDGDDIILTESGNDIVFAGDGNDYIDTSSGADRIDAGAGDDKIVMDKEDFDQNLFMSEIVNGGEGFDTVIIKDDEGVSFDMSLTNVESFIGGDGNDNILGSDNNDIVRGGAGSDTYYTKDGDDIVYIDSEDIVANSSSFVDTGSGYDKIYIDDTKSVEFDVSNTNAEEIISGSGDDILKNTTNEEVTIYGMDGNDTIYVSDSKDILDGGEGIDTLNFSNSNSGININLSTNVLLGSYAQGDTYTNFENVVGTNSDDTITGNSSDNTIYAVGGNNVIDGDGGFNTAVFSGDLIDYFNNGVMDSIVTNFDNTATVFTDSGINELTNINVLQFDDYKVYIDGTANSPFVYEETINAVEDTNLTISQSQLLENDFSIDNSNLKIVGVKNSENGIVKLNDDGTITFTPFENYNSSTNNIYDENSALYKGEAKFEYIVEDENGNRSSSYATVNVQAVNDAPTITSSIFYRNSYYTGHGKIIIEDVDSDVSSMSINVASNLTYGTTGGQIWVRDDYSWWGHRETTRFTRTGYVNINNRTPDDEGVFHFDYRGSYIGGHHYNTGHYDVFDMRPFTISISDDGDPITGSNIQSTLLNTGTYYHRLRKDPLVIDLDGDGIELEDKYYDSLDDYMVGVSADDAVLVWDKDLDGTISSELETNWVELSTTAANDLDALREIFDSNSDGLFNSDDETWEQFALWQDKNEDGLVSDDEFTKISNSNIEELILEKNDDKEEEYPILEYASYSTKDGDIYDIASAYLDTTTSEDKLSEEDILVLQEATKLNEQLAATSLVNSDDEDSILIEETLLDEDEYEEEYIA